jgi:tetratricopeptide (TPR) repeat protein
MGAHYERARILYQQLRYEQAERELREELLEKPEDGWTHAFLGWCLAKQNRLAEAVAEAEEAVRLAPALAYAHYSLGYVYICCDRLEQAEAALREALRLAPRHAEYLEWLSWAQHRRGDTQTALETVNRGLEIDPEHVGCLNYRGSYLRQLGDWKRSEKTVRAALALDPENAYTHANLGWTLWSKARARANNNVLFVACRPELREALTHFQEALRLSPDWDWPRTGVADVLRARCTMFFRVFILVLGLVFCAVLISQWPPSETRGGVSVRTEPSPVLGVVLVVVGVVTLAVAKGPPYVLMQRTRLGAAVLTSGQRQAAKATTLCLIAAAGAALTGVFTPPPTALAILFVMTALVGPLALTYESSPGWGRKLMAGYAATLACAGLMCVPFLRSPDAEPQLLAGIVLLFGVTAVSWLAPSLGRLVEKRFGTKTN